MSDKDRTVEPGCWLVIWCSFILAGLVLLTVDIHKIALALERLAAK